ncbi:hypothetical protein B0H16DRAFT_1796107 [Mycena metata]|uniref:Uncharacterized protein n=1 Tax=Mycena metata TaxID=1033252 RepID=A0AAD7MII3_9AGAR|nr:hypothetical protein B0H16DRAFT_1796107 [Mycena metata]
MVLSAFRVYTLRFLLLSNIGTIIFVAYPSLSVTPSRRAIAFIVCSLITLHHILVLYVFKHTVDLLHRTGACGATPLGAVSSFDHHAMQGRVITTATVFFRGRLYARSPAIHSVVDTPRPVDFKAARERPQVSFSRERSSQAGFRTIPFNTSASNIHVSAQMETPTNCSRVDRDSFGITTTALVILGCPYRWRMSIRRISTGSASPAAWSEPLWYGMVTWTKRPVRTQGLWPTYTSLFIPEITALQPFPGANMGGTSLTRLTLVNEYGAATKLLQDTAAATVLSGMASFGGLWTFINTAFAFLFGADVVYFAFGMLVTDRYPRSAAARDAGSPVAPGFSGPAFRGRPAYPARRRRASLRSSGNDFDPRVDEDKEKDNLNGVGAKRRQGQGRTIGEGLGPVLSRRKEQILTLEGWVIPQRFNDKKTRAC